MSKDEQSLSRDLPEVGSGDLLMELRPLGKLLILTIFPLVVALGLSILDVLSVFGIDASWLKGLGWSGVFALVSSVAALGLLLGALRLAKTLSSFRIEQAQKEDRDHTSQKLPSELSKAVERLYRAKSYVEVIRFGRHLSRSFWLSGFYVERVRVGEMINEAASVLGRTSEQVATLIDDIGWTNAVLGKLETAVQNIRYGIELATENGLPYYGAKGHRHLAGIAYRYKDDLESAEHHLDQAVVLAEQILDAHTKEEMLGGIYYARAEFLLNSGELSKAREWSLKSTETYERLTTEAERLVKCRSQLGRIYLGLGENLRARDSFRKGLAEARKLKRQDEIGSSLLGLAQVQLAGTSGSGRERAAKALEAASEAVRIFTQLGMTRELEASLIVETKAKRAADGE